MSTLEALEQQSLADIEACADLSAIEAVRVSILGKKGTLTDQLKLLGTLDVEQRKAHGAAVNILKNKLESLIEQKKDALEAAEIEKKIATDFVDVTLPMQTGALDLGRIHPVSQVSDEIVAIFADLGFAVAEGPDIETDFYNFTALNFPEGHPAREMHDTFFFPANEQGQKKLLRTHTSPVQIRTMEKQKPPIRAIIPGRTYRCDSDQTHTPMFHQVEGLVLEEGANLAQLRWVLEEFCRSFFEVKKVEMRFRPSFFPFTEPSLEVDIRCKRSPEGMRFGEGDDWLEILGCGMVHPNVLSNCGLNPDEVQGYAWGMGIDRLAMLKYGMPDLRAFFENDVRWLSHYGFKPFDIPSLVSGLSR